MVIKIILKINNLWPELFNFQNSFYLFETLSHINITATTYIINIHVRQKCHQHQTRALKCFAKGHSHRKNSVDAVRLEPWVSRLHIDHVVKQFVCQFFECCCSCTCSIRKCGFQLRDCSMAKTAVVSRKQNRVRFV